MRRQPISLHRLFWLALATAACGPAATIDEATHEKTPPVDDDDGKADRLRGGQGGALDVVSRSPGGAPTFVRGKLGRVENLARAQRSQAGGLGSALDQVAARFQILGADLEHVRTDVDQAGGAHVRHRQVANGLPVLGAGILVHVSPAGDVYAANGLVKAGGLPSPTPRLDEQAARRAVSLDGLAPAAGSRLVYTLTTRGTAFLAWEIEATGTRADGTPIRDLVYVDAATGRVVDRRAQIHTARSRRVSDAKGAETTPGTLARSEGQAASTDASVNAAYDNTGTTYDCYAQLFGRDGIDGSGGALLSTVHYGHAYNNAFWDGTQMVYGDGDGQELGPLAFALDVTAHELTHGVTEHTSGLRYENEPGGINEALSDIFGATCEAWRNGVVDQRTWLLGEDIWTPSTPGDALRYMDDPTKDNYSKDYYPEKIADSSSPSQFDDYGGVHGNSGIANLAYKLLVTGGRHPRSKTTVEVPALGIEQARAIYYRAQTAYIHESTDFAALKAATTQAATDLYGATAAAAVTASWDAVGVGAGGGAGGGGTPDATTVESGTPVTGLSGARNDKKYYVLAVPANARNVTVTLAGGSGDPDLYVRRGQLPTTSAYDGRSWLSGTAESVTLAGQEGKLYILVHAYAQYSGTTLTATWQ